MPGYMTVFEKMAYRWSGVSLCLVPLLLVCGTAGAAQQTDREVIRSIAGFHFYEKDYKGAISLLTDHVKADPGDDAAWNMLGLAHLKESGFKKAEEAFSRAASSIELLSRARSRM